MKEDERRCRIHERKWKEKREGKENMIFFGGMGGEKKRKRKVGRERVVCGWKTLETIFIVAKVMNHSEY